MEADQYREPAAGQLQVGAALDAIGDERVQVAGHRVAVPPT
jgi:hypothetical protein